jgi:hypothetical protein
MYTAITNERKPIVIDIESRTSSKRAGMGMNIKKIMPISATANWTSGLFKACQDPDLLMSAAAAILIP